MSEKKCPKCDDVIEAGKLVSYGPTSVVSSKSTGALVPSSTVVAYRCEKCGYVGLYVE